MRTSFTRLKEFGIIATIGATSALLGFSGPAVGDEAGPGRSIEAIQIKTVDAAGLNLANVADVEILYRRIRKAAQSACRAEAALWDVKRVLHRRECFESAVEYAVNDMNNPLLTAAHRGELERLAGLKSD